MANELDVPLQWSNNQVIKDVVYYFGLSKSCVLILILKILGLPVCYYI